LCIPRSYVCGERSASLGRYYAVFDGHGGEGAAAHAAATLRANIEAALADEEADAARARTHGGGGEGGASDDADASAHAQHGVGLRPVALPAYDAPPPAPGGAREAALSRAVVAGFLATDAQYAHIAARCAPPDTPPDAPFVACAHPSKAHRTFWGSV
jgi:hypothetical protein